MDMESANTVYVCDEHVTPPPSPPAISIIIHRTVIVICASIRACIRLVVCCKRAGARGEQ
eukprot:103608-Pelagomonas_calceolata.AAC.2